jgi:hypothetical protein
MAKTNMLCPFNHKLCEECPLYRGRHYYLCFCQKYRGYIGGSEQSAKSGVNGHPVDLLAVFKQIEPWADVGLLPGIESKVKLKVIDMEDETTRVCDLDEAKTWDWSNPEIMRMIGGVQITSWNKLVEVVSFKAKKGYKEVELYEAPRFMMLGGG